MINDPLFSTPMYKRNLSTNFQGKILKLTADFRQKQMFEQPRDREIRENKFSRNHRKFESRKKIPAKISSREN